MMAKTPRLSSNLNFGSDRGYLSKPYRKHVIFIDWGDLFAVFKTLEKYAAKPTLVDRHSVFKFLVRQMCLKHCARQ